MLLASVTLGDLDGDGDVEVGVGSIDGSIYIWDLPGLCKPAFIDWQNYHHDNWFTGWYHPKKPVNLNALSIGNIVQLSWSPNKEPDVDGYNIYRSDSTANNFQKINSGLVTDTTYEDNTVLNGEEYIYVVTAHIRAGNESRYSEEAVVSVATSTMGSHSQNPDELIVHLTPNPVCDVLKIECYGEYIFNDSRIFISNLSGKPMLPVNVTSRKQGTFIDVSSLPSGTYF